MPNPPAHLEHAGLWSPGRRALTIGLVLSVTMVASEALAVATIMPIVADDLSAANRDLYGAVFSGFLLASLVGIVFTGLLIDRGSLVRPFLLGVALFSAGLIVGGLAPSMEILVAGRILQGFGAGAVPSVAYVSIGRALPEALRPRMFATLSTAWVLPGVVGPALAGIVAEQLHWRVVFLGLLPLIGLAAALTLPALAAVRPAAAGADGDPDHVPATPRRLGFAVLLAVGAGMAVAGLTDARPFPGLALIVAGIAIGVPAFARLTPAGTLRLVRGLPATVLLRGFLTFAFFTADAYVPLALEDWRHTSATEAGIVLTAATLSWTAGAWIQARWIGRYGPPRFVRTGFALAGLGVLGFAAVLSPSIPIVIGVLAWAVAGCGMGLAYSPLSLITLREAPPHGQGAATAGLQLSDVLGTSLGAGVGGALIALGHREGAEAWVGLAWSFGIGAVVAALGFLLAGRVRPRAATPAPEPVGAADEGAGVADAPLGAGQRSEPTR
jgi:MFS family permease